MDDIALEYRYQRPKCVKGLSSLDLDGIVSFINEGNAKKILIFSGAGTSVASGIPDFRSPKIGLYSQLKKYNLPRPESIFTRDYFKYHPEPFFSLIKDFLPGKYKPSPAHFLAKLFENHGILLRHYSQNIDGLDKAAGLSEEHLVEWHGTLSKATCRKCSKKYTLDDIKPKILAEAVPRCSCGGVIQPDVMLYGDYNDDDLYTQLDKDVEQADLLFVLGTSLKVEPFPSMIENVSYSIPRVLINADPVCTYDEKLDIKDGLVTEVGKEKKFNLFKFGHFFNTRDIFIPGDIQENVIKLIEKLGWKNEFDEIYNKTLNKYQD